MPISESAHDFDFLFGDWTVRHRRLKERLVGCDDWEGFDGTCVVRPMQGSAGNTDDNVVNLATGTYRAISLRSFDETSKTWAIWWLDGRRPHEIDVPVRGAFDSGVGLFTAHDSLHGQPITVRFRWTDTTSTSPVWDQAFSVDDGCNWELNWIMKFDRLE